MNAITKAPPMAVQEPQRGPIKNLSPVLLGRYPTSNDEADEARRQIEELEKRAKSVWIAQQAVMFLTGHYFVTDMAEPVAEYVGRSWTKELSGFPDWAIEAAFAWWISRNNPDRRKKPQAGDISARAQVEAAIIVTGRKQIEFFERYGNNPPAFLK